jgi:hypothetical protein
MSEPSIGEKPERKPGTFQPGNKMGGRKKIPDEIKEKLSKATPIAVQFWIDTMLDTEADLNMRIRCSENIVDRDLGKAVQAVNADVTAEMVVHHIGKPDFAK